MTDQSQKFTLESYKDTPECTSLPESEDGPLPSDGQDGQTTNPSGQDHVRVSRFRAVDSEKDMPINDISGPLFIDSSLSADLQKFLESRLVAILDTNGSPEYELTWKQRDMPAGLPICALRPSVRRTSGNGCTGRLSTPMAGDYRHLGKSAPYPANLKRASIPALTRLLVRGLHWRKVSGAICQIMGYPLAWNNVRPRLTATQLFRKSQQNS